MSFPCLFFNDTATTEIYTLSLHDALPISPGLLLREEGGGIEVIAACQAVVYSGLARDPALERGLRAHAERGDCPQPRHDDPAVNSIPVCASHLRSVLSSVLRCLAQAASRRQSPQSTTSAP